MPELDFERITLNAIPDGDMPVFHASQFETMRPFMADLKWGSEDFAPGDSCWCTLSIRKTDDTLVIIDDIELVTNTVSCILSQQAVACIGDNFCQLKVWATSEDDEDGCIACLNFILHVQPDPEADGITSESEINNLTEQIEEITQQVIGDDYYTKVQTDALLDLKADKSTTYTKTETDTLLGYKADASQVYTRSQTDTLLADKADKSTTYTKTQIDTALALKANAATTYTKTEVDTALALKADASDVYTKTEVDNIILGIMPVDSVASSPIASFNTALAVDLVDVKTNLKPSLSGYSALNLTACGANLFDGAWFDDGAWYNSTNLIKVSEGASYYANTPNIPNSENLFAYYYDKNKNRISDTKNRLGRNSVFTIPSGVSYIRLLLWHDFDYTNLSINSPSTDTQYHAYTGNTYTITFGQTVYGGTLDVTTGELTVNKNTITFDGSEGWYEYARGTDTVVYALQNAVDSILNENDQFSNLFTYNARAFDSSLNTPNIFVLGTSKRLYAQVNISDYANVTAFQTALSNTNLKVNYNVTETTIDLGSGTAVTARAGVNNVYSDTGDTTVQFKDSIQHYIDTRV